MDKEKQQQPDPRFAAFVGLDWSDKKHTWSLETLSGTVEQGEFGSRAEDVQQWVDKLNERFGGAPIAIGLEQTRGAILWMLSAYSNLWLYLIHPKAATDFRKVLHQSGTKNDPVDARVIRTIVQQLRSSLRLWRPDSSEIEQLRSLVQRRRRLVDEKTQQTNRLTAELKVCFPQILDWFDAIGKPIVIDFLRQWPTLANLQKARPQTVLAFFRKHNSHSSERNKERLDEIARAKPVTENIAVLRPAQLEVRIRLAIVEQLNAAIGEIDNIIKGIYATHPDGQIFASFPAAGPAMGPRLLAAFGSCREHFRSASELQAYSGIAPIERSSGRVRIISQRHACPKFLRQTFHEYASHTIDVCPWAGEFYRGHRATGHTHHESVRALAYKWIRILYRCWMDRLPYNEARYAGSSRKRAADAVSAVPAGTVEIQWKTCGGMKKATKISY